MPKLSGSAHGTLTKFFRELSRTYIHNTAVQEQRQRIRTIAQVMPYLHRRLNSLIIRAEALVTQVNRMSRSRRVLAIGGKQRILGLDMVCIETILLYLDSL